MSTLKDNLPGPGSVDNEFGVTTSGCGHHSAWLYGSSQRSA